MNQKSKAIVRAAIEVLENRQLMTLTLASPFSDITAGRSDDQATIDLTSHFTARPLVDMNTTLGVVKIELNDQDTPLTVANFLKYVDAGLYSGTVFHRVARTIDPNTQQSVDFILQGGRFTWTPPASRVDIEKFAPVVNEFKPGITTNVFGTIAMAKIGGDPDSATDEFFFNLGDNTDNLDNQNGGFAAFGKVVGGTMSVVQSISSNKNVQELGIPAEFYDDLIKEMPLNNFSFISQTAIQNSNLFKINSAVRGANPVVYSVLSSNPDVVTGSIDSNGQLHLKYGLLGGDASITVTATTTLDGTQTQDTFNVQVAAPFIVTLGGANPRQARFTDSDGTFVNVKFTRGTTTLVMRGDNQSSTVVGRSYTVINGDNLGIRAIITDENLGSGTFGISTRGGTTPGTTVGSITMKQSVFLFNAPGVDVSNDVNIIGSVGHKFTLNSASTMTIQGAVRYLQLGRAVDLTANGIGVLSAGSITGNVVVSGSVSKVLAGDLSGSLSLGGTGGSSYVALNNVTSSNLTCTQPLNTLIVRSWNGGTIQAPAIGTLISKSNFAATVTLNRNGVTRGLTLGSATINGTLGSGNWTITGTSGGITAGRLSMTSGNAITVTEALRFLAVRGDATNLDLLSASIGAVSVSGNLTSSLVSANGALAHNVYVIGKVTVGKTMQSTAVQAIGNIQRIAAGAMLNCQILAGMTSAKVPTALSDFAHASTIGVILVHRKAKTTTFGDTLIAARFLGSVDIGSPGLIQNSVSAIGADSIRAFTFYNGFVNTYRRLDAASDSLNSNSFQVSLIDASASS